MTTSAARTVSDYGSLLPQHARQLHESGIAQEVAILRGYRSIERKTALEQLGFSKQQRSVPGLLLPVWNVFGQLATYQYRPDQPRVKDSKPLKYGTPFGTRTVLDVPPMACPWIADPKRPLFITKGIKKADAMVSRGLCCIALLGVWNWRGTNEWGGKTALADWDAIALNAREIYIVFDSDIMTKPAVRMALGRLKVFLESRGG